VAAPKSGWVTGEPVPMVRGPTLDQACIHGRTGGAALQLVCLIGLRRHVTAMSLPTMLMW